MEEIFVAISTVFQFILNHLFSLNILLAITIVFFERRDPKTIWAWLLVLYFIPVLGFLLYLLVGQDMRRSKMFKNKELEDAIGYAVHKQERRVKSKEIFQSDNENLFRYHDLVMYNLAAAKAVYTDDNEVEIYTDGKEYFRHLYQEIEVLHYQG